MLSNKEKWHFFNFNTVSGLVYVQWHNIEGMPKVYVMVIEISSQILKFSFEKIKYLFPFIVMSV